jgi:hypothetical protein
MMSEKAFLLFVFTGHGGGLESAHAFAFDCVNVYTPSQRRVVFAGHAEALAENRTHKMSKHINE